MTEKCRKLIFFWTYREWGGAQIYFIAIMKEAMAEWNISVVLPRDSTPEIIKYLKEIGVNVEFINTYIDLDPAPTIGRKLKRQWSRINSELKSLRFLSRYDLSQSILHIETSPWQSWIFLTLLSLRRANVFVTLHNAPSTPSKWRRKVWKARMKFVSRLRGFHIFTSNRDTKNKIRDLVTSQLWDETAVTYTGVNPPQIENVLAKSFDRKEMRVKHGVAENAFVVLCVGQFIDRKGRWVFLDAARQLKNDNSNIVFIWVTPNLPNEIDNRRIEEYGLGRNLRLILSSDAGKTREEVLSFFRIGDIFALPSYIEGLPIALLEAMALGLAVISTNVYAIPEAIKHNETGILIEAGDAIALANEIVRLMEEPKFRQNIAEKGRKYVVQKFDERAASQIAIEKYNIAIAEARA